MIRHGKMLMINLPLAGVATAQLKFVFTSDASVAMNGFLIDDIYVGDGTGNFVGASSKLFTTMWTAIGRFFCLGICTMLSGNANATISFGDGTSAAFPFSN